MKNIIEVFLTELGIKHTHKYTEKQFDEHPFKWSLYGINAMLNTYGIQTIAVNYKDKENAELVFPCILHIHGDFVVAKDYKDGIISYIWHGAESKKSVIDFCQIWTGNALLCNKIKDNAKEIDYKDHFVSQMIDYCEKCMLVVLPLFICIIGILQNKLYLVPLKMLSMAASFVGLSFCYTLLQKQLYGESKIGDKVCSVFHHVSCNNVLDSKWAKIQGYSWSEIGFSYFLSRLLIFSLFPDSYAMLCIINWGAMAFGLWSLYIQFIEVKTMCVLCTIVQCIVWIIGIYDLNLTMQNKIFYIFGFGQSVLTLTSIILSVVVVHSIVEGMVANTANSEIISNLRAFKADHDVFKSKLMRERKNIIVSDDSSIIFGNDKANITITVLTNPLCNPCGKMHKRLDDLMRKTNNRFKIQYVFTSFNDELEIKTKFLIGVYQQRKEISEDVFREWYIDGKKSIKDYPELSNINMNDNAIDKQIKYGEIWKLQTGFSATPTVLVNGYKLPDDYQIEDLEYIENL